METVELLNKRLIYLNQLLANSLQQGDIPEITRLQAEIAEVDRQLLEVEGPTGQQPAPENEDVI